MELYPPPPPVQALLPRVHAANVAGVGDLADSVLRIPNAHYTDPDILAAEMRTTFTAPVPLTVSAAIASPGSYVSMDFLGTPVIVSRGKDGRARVLVNACRHRGAKLVEDGEGCVKRFVCPYHAWVYASDGALKAMPDRANGFADVDLEATGLVELPSEERLGYVWAVRSPELTLDLAAHLGPVEAELASWGFEYHVAATMELSLQSNWKCALEAFMETYHFPYVHPDSIVGMGSVANIVTFDQIGRHHRLGVPLATMGTGPEPAPGEQIVVIYYLYPCTVIATSLLGGEMLQFFPGKVPGSSTVRHTVLSRWSMDDPQAREFFDAHSVRIQSAVRDEDAPVLERSGIGLAAGVSDVLLGRNEIGCQAAHRQVLSDLGVAPQALPPLPIAQLASA